MADIKIVFAGFGGQGILFAGKLVAYKGLLENKYVSWLPSYGPEMRGGTANCSVIVSDEQIDSPMVPTPDILMVMNGPSLDTFEDCVAPGGRIFADSSLIDRRVRRTDVETFYVPASQMANEAGMPALANMILAGKLLKETPALSGGSIDAVLGKIISARHKDMLEQNRKALEMGFAV